MGDLEPWLTLGTSQGGQPQIEEFQLQRCLGRGGMGAVFLAHDTKLQRQVALKLMSPGLLADPTAAHRFQREARAAAALNHPNVVTVHSVGALRDLPYLVMELVNGQTLGDRLSEGALPPSSLFPIARQIAEGLAAAHAAGVHHRDIKPANILLQQGTDFVKLTDFGLARTLDSESLTQSGHLVGTPEFISPEQFDPTIGPVDHRSDLFSFGSVLYAMWTGEAPFAGPSVIATLHNVREMPHRPLEAVSDDAPAWFSGLVDQLLEKQPSQRPQSAADVARAISLHQSLPPAAPIITVQTKPRRSSARADTGRRSVTGQKDRRLWGAALAAMALVLGVGYLLGAMNQSQSSTDSTTVAAQPQINSASVDVDRESKRAILRP